MFPLGAATLYEPNKTNMSQIAMDKELIPSSNQNPITGDHLITKASSEAYRSGWDRIFGKKTEEKTKDADEKVQKNKWIHD